MVPTISAYTQLYGIHDYNRHPFAPLAYKIQVHKIPGTRKSWDVHTVTGWYIGVSWEHYRNHRCWIQETRSERSCPTVFFKHKYLTMPTMTPADALIKAADNLNEAIQGVIPEKGQTQEAIEQLMQIFKQQAKSAHNGADSQRVLMEEALSQRVQTEEVAEETENNSELEDSAIQENQYTNPVLTETPDPDEVQESPAMSTRSKATPRTITQDVLMHVAEISGGKNGITAKSAASRKFRIQFLCDYAAAVLDHETGEMLEYRHLIGRPKYKKEWGVSFGNEIGRLAQGMPGRVEGTDTIHFIHKNQLPADRWKDVTYGRICCNFREQKQEKNRTRITVGGTE